MIFGPPPVRGVGRAGGFMVMIEDRGDLGPQALQAQTENLVELANQQPRARARGQHSVFRANVPQVFLDVDRTALMLKGVQLQDSSTRCRSTWARCTSTTSTSSAAPGR